MQDDQSSPKRSFPERPRLQRAVVVGCCGAGKSTFSAALARRLGVPYVERDALGELGSDTYRGAVAGIVRAEGWVFDGPPYFVDDLVYPAAQRVIWLDYSRALVLWRATGRSLRRTCAAPEAGKDGWRGLRQWIAPGGPCFAGSVYAARKREFRQLQHRPDLAGKVLHLGDPAAARAWLASLEAADNSREIEGRP